MKLVKYLILILLVICILVVISFSNKVKILPQQQDSSKNANSQRIKSQPEQSQKNATGQVQEILAEESIKSTPQQTQTNSLKELPGNAAEHSQENSTELSSERPSATLDLNGKPINFFKFSSYQFPKTENVDSLNKRVDDFKKLTLEEQVDLLNNREVYSLKDKPFVLRIVSDKDLRPTTRNEAADLLRTPLFQDAEQWRLYAAMVEDETEKVIDRNYAVQYMANTYEFSSDKAAIEQKLYEYSRMKLESIGSTALLHIYQHFSSGDIKELRVGFADSAARLAADKNAELDDRVTAVCILAETAEARHLPLIREYAVQEESSSLKRTAIAALGERGARADLALIEAAVGHKNFAVKLSAQSAVKRHRDRFRNVASK